MIIVAESKSGFRASLFPEKGQWSEFEADPEKTVEGLTELTVEGLTELGTTMTEIESDGLQFLDAFKVKIFDSNLFFFNCCVIRVSDPCRQPNVYNFLATRTKSQSSNWSSSRPLFSHFDWHFKGMSNIFSEGRTESEVMEVMMIDDNESDDESDLGSELGSLARWRAEMPSPHPPGLDPWDESDPWSISSSGSTSTVLSWSPTVPVQPVAVERTEDFISEFNERFRAMLESDFELPPEPPEVKKVGFVSWQTADGDGKSSGGRLAIDRLASEGRSPDNFILKFNAKYAGLAKESTIREFNERFAGLDLESEREDDSDSDEVIDCDLPFVVQAPPSPKADAVFKSPDAVIKSSGGCRNVASVAACTQTDEHAEVDTRALSKKDRRTLEKMIIKLKREFIDASSQAEGVEVWLRRVSKSDAKEAPSADLAETGGLTSVDSVDDVFVGRISSEDRQSGRWRRLRDGITLDSGSNVDITPEDDNDEFAIVEATGIRKGKTLAAANGTPIPVRGEKWIKFSTREGHNLVWPFIAGKVKKTLKSVGTTCDAGNEVLFTQWGGYIFHESGATIEFERVSNTYAIPVWVRIGSSADVAAQVSELGFTRQVAAP